MNMINRIMNAHTNQ